MKTAVSYPFLGKQQRLGKAFSKDVCGWFGLSNSSSAGELKAAGSSIQKPFFKALLTEHWHSCDSCNAVINNLLSRTGSFWHGFCFVPVPISLDKKIRPYQLLRCTQELSCNCHVIWFCHSGCHFSSPVLYSLWTVAGTSVAVVIQRWEALVLGAVMFSITNPLLLFQMWEIRDKRLLL